MPLSTLADTNDNLKKREGAMGKAEVSIRKTVIHHREGARVSDKNKYIAYG